MREFTNPMKINARNVESAWLKGKKCGKVYNIPLIVTNGDGSNEGVVTLTLPTDYALPVAGVYQIHMKAGCGCFTMKVSITCAPPTDRDSVYTPTTTNGGSTVTNGVPSPIPSCP